MLFLSLIFLYIIYIGTFFVVSIRLGVAAPHYFLGYGRKLFSFQTRGVTFSIGLYIPIIGLARIYIFENGEKYPMKYPWEFFDQSLGKRWLATFSGAVGLFFTGMILFIGIAYFDKELIIAKEEINRNGIYPSKMALKHGFQPGDKIVALNGKDFVDLYDLIDPKVVSTPNTLYTILRGGKKINIPINIPFDSLDQTQYFFSLLVPFEIDQVMAGSPADKAGLLRGDRIIKVNGHRIIKKNEMENEFAEDDDGHVTLTVKRGNDNSVNTFNVDVALDDQNRMGVLTRELVTYTSERNTFSESIVKGTYRALTVPLIQLRGFWKIFSGNVSSKKTLSGPVGIASAFNNNTNWLPVAVLAVNTIVLNFLPLPKSAFWEMIPLIYEGVFRRRFTSRLFQTLKKVVIGILVLLCIFVFISDISALL